MKSSRTLLIILLVLGLAGSYSTLTRRIAAENASRKVQIAVDLDEIQTLVAQGGSPGFEEILQDLKAAGVTSIAVTQSTIGGYLNMGAAHILPVPAPDAVTYEIFCDSPPVARAISESLRAGGFLGPPLPGSSGSHGHEGVIGPVRLQPSEISLIPLGFDTQRQILQQIRQAGLSAVGRVNNFPEVNQGFLDFLSRQMQETGISKVIFAGDEVMGWSGAVEETAHWFQTTPLVFGSIEFSKQKGAEKLEALLKGSYIRVHSISGAEMANYQEAAAVERFVRAARERNVRLLYVRLLQTSGPEALTDNLEYIRDIVRGLHRSGYRPGAAAVTGDPHPRGWELVLMAIAVAAGFALALTEVLEVKPAPLAALFLGAAVALCAVILAGDMGRKIVALVSALVFPTWALARTARMARVSPDAPGAPTAPGWMQTLALYITAIVATVYGGVLIAAILSDRVFMTETDQFAGVKLAHLLPILSIFFLAVSGVLGRPMPWAALKGRITQRLRQVWQTPVLFGYAFVALVALVVLLVVVMRSGNDAGVGVSPLELRFRALLDQFLYVRPRSKEILVGYPALVAAIWLALAGQRAWATFFFTAAMVGLVSALNTFCHIHTPLEISAVRIFNGAWVGLITGVIFVWILKNLGLDAARASAAPPVAAPKPKEPSGAPSA